MGTGVQVAMTLLGEKMKKMNLSHDHKKDLGALKGCF